MVDLQVENMLVNDFTLSMNWLTVRGQEGVKDMAPWDTVLLTPRGSSNILAKPLTATEGRKTGQEGLKESQSALREEREQKRRLANSHVGRGLFSGGCWAGLDLGASRSMLEASLIQMPQAVQLCPEFSNIVLIS